MPSIEVNLKDEWSKETLGSFGREPDKKTPFDVLIYPNLLSDATVTQLREDINSSVKLKLKDNDLYKFNQSKDLKCEIPTKKLTDLINNFIDVMQDDVRQHLEKSTGLKLSTKNFDITVSRYVAGNYLLCHNDDIKDDVKKHGRALAFIYYLNARPWTPEDGGALALFDSDERGEPFSVNNRIAPRPNTLIVFRTSSKSWHSVEEVHCRNDVRLSINGWFHCDKPTGSFGEDHTIEPCPYRFHRPIALDDRLEKFFKEFINQEYLMERTCYMIRKKFKRNSEINLINFLTKEKYQEISGALKEAASNEANLSLVGPYNKRNYKRIHLDKLPQACRDLYDAFKSELFFMLLSRLTGLDLQPPSLIQDIHTKNGDGGPHDDNEDDDDDDDEDESDEEDSEDEDDSESDDEEEDDDDDDNVQVGKESTNDNSKVKAADAQGSILNAICKKPEEGTAATSPEKRSQPGGDEAKSRPKKRKRTSDPLARAEFRHFENGSYTVIHDYEYEMGETSALDVMLHFNHDFEVNFDDGGYISYIDGSTEDDIHDMDCELLTIEPKSNCLSLVYRCDEGTCRFLKHISRSHRSANYQDLSCVYYERRDDLPNGGRDAPIDEQTK